MCRRVVAGQVRAHRVPTPLLRTAMLRYVLRAPLQGCHFLPRRIGSRLSCYPYLPSMGFRGGRVGRAFYQTARPASRLQALQVACFASASRAPSGRRVFLLCRLCWTHPEKLKAYASKARPSLSTLLDALWKAHSVRLKVRLSLLSLRDTPRQAQSARPNLNPS